MPELPIADAVGKHPTPPRRLKKKKGLSMKAEKKDKMSSGKNPFGSKKPTSGSRKMSSK